jgi:hypothetical protein
MCGEIGIPEQDSHNGNPDGFRRFQYGEKCGGHADASGGSTYLYIDREEDEISPFHPFGCRPDIHRAAGR